MVGKIVVIAGVAGLLALAGLGCQQTVPVADYDKVNTELNNQKAQNQGLQTDLEQAKRDKAAAEAELASLKKNMGAMPDGTQAHLVDGRPAMRLDASLMYQSGIAKLTPAGEETLRKVAVVLKRDYAGNEIRVEGHTDADPIVIHKKEFKSNWDLGAQRAIEVVEFLTDKCGVEKNRVFAATFSQYQPVSGNKSDNRRVEIVILPPRTETKVSSGASAMAE